MNRMLFGLLVITATSLALSGQTTGVPAPQTVIRDNAWSNDGSTIVSSGARSGHCSARLTRGSIAPTTDW